MKETSRKATDAKMYTEFRKLYPKLKEEAIGYRHFLYDEIIIVYKNGERGIYNRVEKKHRFPDAFEKKLIIGY